MAQPGQPSPRRERGPPRTAVASTAWYRFTASWRRLAAGYVALVLVVGLGGGLALGSIAAARRTASSFTTFLASTNPSDLTIEPAGGGSGPPSAAAVRQLTEAIRRFPHVRHVESHVALAASFRIGSHRSRNLSSVLMVGSVEGLWFNQDRFTVTEGRQAAPRDPHQVMVTTAAAQVLGVHVGQSFEVAVQGAAESSHTASYPVTVVGIGDVNRDVVQDQIERFPTYVVATPALTRGRCSPVPS